MVKRDLLADDARLKALIPDISGTISDRTKRIRLPRLLAWTGKYAKVRLYAEGVELTDASVFVAFDKVKASELMDAIAALWLLRWQKDTPRSYRLLLRGGELDEVYPPASEDRRERYAAGTEFMDKITALPKGGAGDDLQSGQIISAGDLSPELQQVLARLIAADGREAASKGFDAPFPRERLSDATLRLKTMPHKQNEQGFTSWFMNIKLTDWGEMGFMFTDYEQKIKKRPADADKDIFTPVKFQIPTKEVLKVPALRRSVRLSRKNATVTEALQALHDQYGIAVLADAPEYMKERADVAIRSETMGEAFEQLAALFPGMQWEYRLSKFFIVRGANNPAVKATH